MKESIIEFMDYNVLISLIDYFSKNIEGKTVNNKSVSVYSSYSDKHMPYISPAMSIELLHRKNKSIALNNFLGEKVDIDENKLNEIEGVFLEYTVQLNVYSNTRGEIHKWCSILDDILKIGEDGIPLNCYTDSGIIKKDNMGTLDYFYTDIKNNNLIPNIVSYDFHSFFEIKIRALQQYQSIFDLMSNDINLNNN
jgi:hypothetical protein